MDSMHLFPFVAAALLGIERLMYGWIFHFPESFKEHCRSGKLGKKIRDERLYYKSMQYLSMYVKVFQFGVMTYDIFVKTECSTVEAVKEMFTSGSMSKLALETIGFNLAAGLFLLFVGQVLNVSVYNKLGSIGVYYGYELGYKVERCYTFPYSIGISDPQYWGVLLTVWGTYVSFGASSYLVPLLETVWYLLSMKLIEAPRGRTLMEALGLISGGGLRRRTSVAVA